MSEKVYLKKLMSPKEMVFLGLLSIKNKNNFFLAITVNSVLVFAIANSKKKRVWPVIIK
jgi:hypothetical protein